MDGLLNLAQDIVKKAEWNNTQAIYQDIPGMYNQKIIEPNSIDRDELPDDIQIIKYNGIIDNIKK